MLLKYGPKSLVICRFHRALSLYITESGGVNHSLPWLCLIRYYYLDDYFCTFAIESRCKFRQPSDNDIDWQLNSAKNQLKRTDNTGPDADVSDGTKLGEILLHNVFFFFSLNIMLLFAF